MKKFLLVILVLVFGCSTGGRKPVLGTYRIKFASYGMFGTTIELKADSTFVKNFSGDMMNDNSYEKWSVLKDTLMLSFDTLNYHFSRYRKREKYLIRKRKLIQTDNYLIAELKKRGVWDTLPRKFKRNIRDGSSHTTMIDFKGTMRKNYYILVE